MSGSIGKPGPPGKSGPPGERGIPGADGKVNLHISIQRNLYKYIMHKMSKLVRLCTLVHIN